MGHVPPGTVRVLRSGRDLQGRQHRGAPGKGAVAIPAQARRSFGAYGEARALAWHAESGHDLPDANWRCRESPLDLVVRRGSTAVSCEVKIRSGSGFRRPAEAVSATKQARVGRLGDRRLSENPDGQGGPACDLWSDVSSVLHSRVDGLEAAF